MNRLRLLAPIALAGSALLAGCVPTPEPEPTPVDPPTIESLVASDEPLLIPHAGGDWDAPHSTPYAYQRAVDAGAQVLEMDVMLTEDGQLVVHHDDTVDRITEGSGAVAQMTLAELQALDAAYWFVPECWSCHDRAPGDYELRGVRTGVTPAPAGFRPDDFIVPTFRQIAQRFPEAALDVEVKGSGAQGLAVVDALADELEALDRVESTIVVSFDDAIVAAMRARLPEVALSPATNELTAWAFYGQPLGDYPVIQIPPSSGSIPLIPALVEKAQAEGVEVWIWPNDPSLQENAEYYTELIDAGVDGVIAGSPSRWPY